MSAELASLERRMYRATDDGIADILAGLFFVAVGVAMSFQLGINVGLVSGLFIAAAFPAWRRLRRAISEPRVGYVRVHAARSRRVKLGQCLGAAAMALVVLVGVFLTNDGPQVDTWFPGLVYAIPIVVIGYFADLPRWYWYGAVIMLERVLDSWMAGPSAWLFWPAGTIIAVSGLLVLAGFLRRYARRQANVTEDV